jgi:predicted aldo/keto reductase-like oxidoreductase
MMAGMSRRKFLGSAAVLALASGINAHDNRKEKEVDKTANILNFNSEMKYRRMGKMDVHLSVLSLGGIGMSETIANYAIDRGINLIHMSPTYREGRSILELAKVLKGKREKVYIAMKDNFYKGSVDDINDVLKILNTDYIDFIMFNRHNASQVDDPRIYELFEKWRAQGKAHYIGLTTHNDVKKCVHTAIESGKYHLVMPSLNQPGLENMTEELKAANEKGVSIMAMKTLKGIDDEKLQMAFLKKLMQNPAITTVTKAINSFDMLDLLVETTQKALSMQEDISLYRYAQKNRSNNCMMCGECKKACPYSIEISTSLRCKMYYYDQLEDKELALNTYQSIPPANRFENKCNNCYECENVCPNYISIIQKLEEASNLFKSLSV